MAPARSLRTTFSQVAASRGMLSGSTACRDSSAVLSRSLWQLTQYRLSSCLGSGSAGLEAAAVCVVVGGAPPDGVWAAPARPASQTTATTISAFGDTNLLLSRTPSAP